METEMKQLIKCNKLAQKKYNTKNDWVGMVSFWEFCKRLRFVHSTKLESLLENKEHKIVRDFGKKQITQSWLEDQI